MPLLQIMDEDFLKTVSFCIINEYLLLLFEFGVIEILMTLVLVPHWYCKNYSQENSLINFVMKISPSKNNIITVFDEPA